ncbi:MAG: hypothetical protein WAM82_24320 [Thermoanaerobaculia bacterium]
MLRSIRSTPHAWLLVLAFVLLATPATAEVFHVTLTNGNTVDSSVQPQQASWDPNVVMLLTEVGNWVGFAKDEIAEIKAVDPTAGFGVRISSTAIALGRFSNDLPDSAKNANAQETKYLDLASRALEAAERQQHYSVQQFVEPNQTQGIPASFAGYGSGGLVPGGGPVVTAPPPSAPPAAPVPPSEK